MFYGKKKKGLQGQKLSLQTYVFAIRRSDTTNYARYRKRYASKSTACRCISSRRSLAYHLLEEWYIIIAKEDTAYG